MVPRIVGGTELMAALCQSIVDSDREDKAKAKAPAAVRASKSKKARKREAVNQSSETDGPP
jgi:hypothetical protein